MTRAQLITHIDQVVYDNINEEITAAGLNAVLKELVNNAFILADDSVFKGSNTQIAAMQKSVGDERFIAYNTEIKSDMMWDGVKWVIIGIPELNKTQADKLVSDFGIKLRNTFIIKSSEDNTPFILGGRFIWEVDNAGNLEWKMI